MKTYRISEAQLSAPAGVVIVINFGDKGRHEVLLEEAAAYLRSSQGLVGRLPTGIALPDNRKVGAFPCIIAKTERAAAAMSSMVGYMIDPGDGVRCCTQLQARERVVALRAKGVRQSELDCRWMVSQPEPTVESEAKKPAPQWSKEQLEAAQEKLPF